MYQEKNNISIENTNSNRYLTKKTPTKKNENIKIQKGIIIDR